MACTFIIEEPGIFCKENTQDNNGHFAIRKTNIHALDLSRAVRLSFDERPREILGIIYNRQLGNYLAARRVYVKKGVFKEGILPAKQCSEVDCE